MKTRYYTRSTLNGIEIMYKNQKEAFDLAVEIAKQTGFDTWMNQRTWDDEGRIVEYNSVFVKADGTWRRI